MTKVTAWLSILVLVLGVHYAESAESSTPKKLIVRAKEGLTLYKTSNGNESLCWVDVKSILLLLKEREGVAFLVSADCGRAWLLKKDLAKVEYYSDHKEAELETNPAGVMNEEEISGVFLFDGGEDAVAPAPDEPKKGKVALGGRRGKSDAGFAAGYAEGGAGGMGDMLTGLIGGGSSSVSTKKEEKREGKAPKKKKRTKRSGGGHLRNAPEPGLRAGFADDNEQYNKFLHFLEKHKSQSHRPFAHQGRVELQWLDSAGTPWSWKKVVVFSAKKKREELHTYADGKVHLYPSLVKGTNSLRILGPDGKEYKVDLRQRTRYQWTTSAKSPIKAQSQNTKKEVIPVDLSFVLDCTGSMAEEIERLKQTISLIYANLSMHAEVDLRMSLVEYRDINDSYRTRITPFTGDLESFASSLSKAAADGGGDSPEDLEKALENALHDLQWRDGGVKLIYVITDAPSQMYADQKKGYVDLALEARRQGVKIHNIGTGGLNTQGEYMLRQIAQLTQGRYIFLHYGEQGESDGGHVAAVSHHSGRDYPVDKLENIILGFTREELAWSVSGLEKYLPGQKWIDANWNRNNAQDEQLQDALEAGLVQLYDFASINLDAPAQLALVGIESTDSSVVRDEYLYQQLSLALVKNAKFSLLERQKLEEILKEQAIQMSGVSAAKQVEIGKMAGAGYLLLPALQSKNEGYELFLKLVSVESSEVISLSFLKLGKEFLGN
jgi:Mg-chelatase subunit ChlD